MKWTNLTALVLATVIAGPAQADPEADRLALRDLYQQAFSDIDLAEFKDGVYAIDAKMREQWLEMEDFPPYEIAIDEGDELYNTPFANGKSYADCFGEDPGVKHNYPMFDEVKGEVVTLEVAINKCRQENGEEALPWLVGELAQISAYMAFNSRGNHFEIKIDSPAALAAYEDGKQFYYTRRGQMNFECRSCHQQNVGHMLRAERISPSLGHTTHWPVYRGRWQYVGNIQKRFQECNIQVRAVPFEAQSSEYRNLEYFLTYMNNGMELNGPGSRR